MAVAIGIGTIKGSDQKPISCLNDWGIQLICFEFDRSTANCIQLSLNRCRWLQPLRPGFIQVIAISRSEAIDASRDVINGIEEELIVVVGTWRSWVWLRLSKSQGCEDG